MYVALFCIYERWVFMGSWNKKGNNYDEEEVDLKVKGKRFLIKTMIISVIGFIYAAVGFLIAYLIASRNNYKLQDAAFSAGCLIVILGLFMIMYGGSSSKGLNSWGARSDIAANHWLLQTILQDQNNTNNDGVSHKHAVMGFATNRFSFLLGGAFLIAFSILFL